MLSMDSWLFLSLGILCVLSALFCLFFFRDFNRNTIHDESLIYSPGDGRILEVSTVQEGDFSGWSLIRIFLSVFNGHVQRAPVSGQVERVIYKKGRFFDARDARAHFENEQNAVTLTTGRGNIIVTQIAGLIARRIVCWIKEGDQISQGDRYGLIRFGSQVDVLLPPGIRIKVEKDQKVFGGATVLGTWAQ